MIEAPTCEEMRSGAIYRSEGALREMYVHRDHTVGELASMWNCSEPTIRRYLAKYDIGDHGERADAERIEADTADIVVKTAYPDREHLLTEHPSGGGRGGHGSPLSVDGEDTFYCAKCGSRVTVGPDGTEFGHAKGSTGRQNCKYRERYYTDVEPMNEHETTYRGPFNDDD